MLSTDASTSGEPTARRRGRHRRSPCGHEKAEEAPLRLAAEDQRGSSRPEVPRSTDTRARVEPEGVASVRADDRSSQPSALKSPTQASDSPNLSPGASPRSTKRGVVDRSVLRRNVGRPTSSRRTSLTGAGATQCRASHRSPTPSIALPQLVARLEGGDREPGARDGRRDVVRMGRVARPGQDEEGHRRHPSDAANRRKQVSLAWRQGRPPRGRVARGADALSPTADVIPRVRQCGSARTG